MKKTKTLFVLLIACMIQCSQLFAQAPQAIPYQGVARNNNGNILANQNVSLRFSIHDGAANGTIVYQETQTATTSTLGLFDVNIGLGTPIIGTLAGVNWGSGSKWLQLEMDATGGINYDDLGTSQLMSSPYSLFSGSAGNAGQWTTTGNDVYNSNSGNVGIGTITPAAKLHVAGNVKIADGTQGAGKILTSDANGLASWQTSDFAQAAAGLAADFSCTSLVGSVPNINYAWNLFKSGNYAYEIDFTGNALNIYDVSNVNSPVITSVTATGTQPRNVVVSGNYAYVNNLNEFRIYDVTDATAPVLLSTTTGYNSGGGMAVSGNYFYIIAAGSLNIFDVSVPTAPVFKSSIASGDGGVEVSGNKAYVTGFTTGDLRIYDVSVSTAPLLLGTISASGSPQGLAISGSYAYVVAGSGDFYIYDVSAPASPVLKSNSTPAPSLYSVAVSGNYAYLGDYNNNKILVYDISNPVSPVQKTMINIGGYPMDLQVEGNYAYVATPLTLKIYQLACNSNNTSVTINPMTGQLNSVAPTWSNNGNNISNNNLGSVGIGTSTPQAKLDVVGGDALINGKNIGTGGGNISTNTVLGSYMGFNQTGYENVAIGPGALNANTIGHHNFAIGLNSMYYNTSGSYNLGIGIQSLIYNNGSNNVGIGNGTLGGNFTGSNNTALGYNADVAANNLSNATAIGYGAIVNASNKVQIGDGSVNAVQLGTGSNVTLETGLVKLTGGGPGAGKILTSDANGLASWAAPTSLSGSFVDLTTNNQQAAGDKYFTNDIHVGDFFNNPMRIGFGPGGQGYPNNIVIGNYGALNQNTTGELDIAIGFGALGGNTTGGANIGIGYGALQSNSVGYNNNSIGVGSMALTTGSNNTAFGKEALHNNTSGGDNTSIGYYALINNTTGSLNTAVGSNADVALGNLSNATAIGSGAIVDASNKVQIGNIYVNAVQLGTGSNVTLETGLVKLTGGTPGAGKILTSDANGLASWQTGVASPCGYSIGQNVPALGGIIFYLDASGCHGLAAYPTDEPTFLMWATTNVNTNAFEESVNGGKFNDAMIKIAHPTTGDAPAMEACESHSVINNTPTFVHWYLPSLYELELMYKNIGPGAPAPNTNIGNLNGSHWSSTQRSNTQAWLFDFGTGGLSPYGDKDDHFPARAIRAF